MLLLLPSYLLAGAALIPGVVLLSLFVLLFVFTLNLTAMDDELLKALESIANEPFNLKHHVAYMRLALQVQDGGEMAADADSDGKRSTSHRQQVIRVLGACQGPSNSHIDV